MVIGTEVFPMRHWDASGTFILAAEASDMKYVPAGGHFTLVSEVTGSRISMISLPPIRDPEGELACWCWMGALPDGRSIEARIFND